MRAPGGMVVVLLVLFPILLMVATPLAWVDIALAIALICASRLRAPRRPAPHPIDYDANV